MSNLENQTNAKVVCGMLAAVLDSTVSILDLCCGVYSNSTNYDPSGQIYEPIVAEFLSKKGYEVTGLDFRKNAKKILYEHESSIDLLEKDWVSKVHLLSGYPFAAVLFLRSWDTPELLFAYQKDSGLSQINQINKFMAEDLLTKFASLLGPTGYLVTSEIFNLGLENSANISTERMLSAAGFDLLQCIDGLYLARLRTI